MSDAVLRVNGQTCAVQAPTAEPLATTLGTRLKLHSVRETCGIGICGSCTVLLDGAPVSSCLLLTAMVAGQEVVTAEGLAEAGGRALQEEFVKHEAYQCSFCIPAMTVAAHALLRDRPDAGPEAIREHLAGNLCRCGTYQRIVEAVVAARGAYGVNKEEAIDESD